MALDWILSEGLVKEFLNIVDGFANLLPHLFFINPSSTIRGEEERKSGHGGQVSGQAPI